MPPANRSISTPPIALDRSSDRSLQRQIYDSIRRSILDGALAPGTSLPSTRQVALDCAVSRNTVLNAWEMLQAEGFIESRVGSGSRVCRSLPDDLRSREPSARHPSGRRRISSEGQAIRGHITDFSAGAVRPFSPLPSVESFPVKIWSRLVARHWRTSPRNLLGYDEGAGLRTLRKAIAEDMGLRRGIRCDADQVIIVGGSQQALSMTARVLLEPGCEVVVEDPSYPGARTVFSAIGAQPVPVPVERDGIDVDFVIRHHGNARAAYVTPSQQYPLGVTLSLAKRLRLLEWAEHADAWIIEDDFDSEFGYSGLPLSSLQGIDASQRVIYVGTFTRVLVPAIRIGFIIAPPDLVDLFVSARILGGRSTSTVEQAALADFIEEGHLGRHLKRMRSLYRGRRERLVQELRRQIPAWEIDREGAGIRLVCRLPADADEEAIARAAGAHGVEVLPLSRYAIEALLPPALLLGFGSIRDSEITRAVARLCEATAASS